MAGFAATSPSGWLRLRRRPPAGSGAPFVLTGQLTFANGDAIVGAAVYLFDFATNALVAMTTSDGSGNYQFNPPTNGPYWTTFYLAGAPEIFGRSGMLIPS